MSKSKKITFAIKALILEEDKFLIVRRTQSDPVIWELPGGHLEYGETAETAIIREIQEELSIDVQPVRLLDTWNAFLEIWQIIGIIYLCTADSFSIRLSEEHSDFKWVKYMDKDFKLLHPEFQRCMNNCDWDELLLL